MATTIFYHFPSYPYENASEQLKRLVWQKAAAIDNIDPDHIRSDPFGLAICYSEHGNRNSDMGWEMVFLTGQGEQQTGTLEDSDDNKDLLDPEERSQNDADTEKLFPVNWRMNHRERQN